jgi:hypothetical protein
MPDLKTLIGVTALILTVIQFAIYIKDIHRGKTKPHAMSWMVWSLPCYIVFLAQYYANGGLGALTTGLTAVICTYIFFLAIIYGEKHYTLLDWISLITAGVAILTWVIVKSPLYSVILITIVDTLGFFPTGMKCITRPHEETLICYELGGMKWVLSIFALSSFSFTTVLYPLVMGVANFAVASTIIFSKRSQEKLVLR